MTGSIRALGSILMVAFCLQGCEPGQDTARIQALESLMESGNVPGLQLATVAKGRVHETLALGRMDASSSVPVTSTTVFEAASLSKTVTAYIAFRLVDRGELSLDEPLWDLIEYERLAHDERARAITPRMVLSHTSGLPNWGGTPLELNNDPGTEWSYSGEGFVFLQRAMEALTGRPLEELAESEVFEPMGLAHTSFVWKDAYEKTKAMGHDLLGRPDEEPRRRTEANAAASLHTTARDYGTFLAAVLRGDGLSEASHAEMIEPVVQADARGSEETHPHVSWGLGWGVQDSNRGRAIWHWGDNGVFRAFVVGYPETEDGLVYFTNSEAGLSIAESLLGHFFQDTFWAVRWLDYARWDDPIHRARLALRASFLQGYETGMATLDSLLGSPSLEGIDESVVAEELERAMTFLAEEGEPETALHLAQDGVRDRPDDAGARLRLAEMQTEARRYAEALETYRLLEGVEVEGVDLEGRMQWLEEGLAESGEVVLSPDELERLAGQYGPRRVRVEDGGLKYSREGAPETNLIPLTRYLFGLESSATFRLRFERESDGVFRTVYGLYSDGRMDESSRKSTGGTGP